jgi:hypothetical protein
MNPKSPTIALVHGAFGAGHNRCAAAVVGACDLRRLDGLEGETR